MQKEKLGTLLAIITAIFSGIAIPANKVFIVNMDPLVFTAVRSIIIGAAFLALTVFVGRRNKPAEKGNKTSPTRFPINWKYMAGVAVIGGTLAFYLYFTGLKLTTASRAAFLHKTLPLYTAVLAFVFLKEKLTKKYLGAMVLMIVGVIAVYSTTLSPSALWSDPQLGDLLIITATFLWAVENVLARKAMKSGSTNFIVSFSRMFFGGLILFGVLILLGRTSSLMLSESQLLAVAVSTILLFCYTLFYYWSLGLINVSKAAVLLLIAPVITLAVSVTVLSEPAPMLQIAGSAVILVGAYLIAGVKSEERGI